MTDERKEDPHADADQATTATSGWKIAVLIGVLLTAIVLVQMLTR